MARQMADPIRRLGLLCTFAVLASTSLPRTLSAQGRAGPVVPSAGERDATAAAVAAWVHLDAPPGGEAAAHRVLTSVLPGWNADGFGNLVRRVGSGRPRTVIACAMDIPGFVVSQITDAGYVRLHRTGGGGHPLWDQFHEAQQVRVLTARGEVTGVVGIANGHFARQHRADTAIVTVDALWVDLGVETRAQAEALGVALLDPVVAVRPVWTYAGLAAGPAAGARAGCAAVASAADAAVRDATARDARGAARAGGTPASNDARGETVFVLSTQRAFGWVGLAAVIARLGAVDGVTLLDEGRTAARTTITTLPITRLGPSKSRLSRVLPGNLVGDSLVVVSPRVRYDGTMVESIDAVDALALRSAALGAAGLDDSATRWIAPVVDTTTRLTRRTDAFGAIESTFFGLADLPGVPGHEWRVRDAIRAQLPPFARSAASVDTAGNLIVALGPDRDTVAFIAHMDEVSFEIESILRDGRVRLNPRGGVVRTAWEGQPAVLHFDADDAGRVRPALRGVFVPRDTASRKPVGALTAWFGMDSAGLVAQGVRAGAAITGYKHAARLANARLTARGSDDRTGSTAMLHALKRIVPSSLTHKVLFVWSTREEGGLLGASAFAADHGRNLRRIYSIDTFVSSDTPLESPMFAWAPLGRGAVLRGLDDGSLTPRAERERIMQIARRSQIPLQVGTTHGSTDGSAIAPFGAPNVGLSWPGRYSHTPGEVLDLRDVDALIRLITAVAISR